VCASQALFFDAAGSRSFSSDPAFAFPPLQAQQQANASKQHNQSIIFDKRLTAIPITCAYFGASSPAFPAAAIQNPTARPTQLKK
jgi:hypothetical protein